MFAVFATLWVGPEPTAADEAEVQSLVRAARVGNARAARRLYELHVARVYRAVRGLCASDADAEDVTQDAFVDALSSLARYTPRAGARFIGWLVTVALNRARKQRAAAARTEPIDEGAERHGGSEEEVVRRRALLDALATLPERDRHVVSLFYGAELSAEEVAAAVGISAANVRKNCERQRKHLLERLEQP